MSENAETAILAGGCFWPAQELLRHHDGMISTRVGYTGGESDNPTADHHPGHAEAVEVSFDPERTSYRDILEFFFQSTDPTLAKGLSASTTAPRSSTQATSSAGSPRTRSPTPARLGPVARQGRNQDQRGRPFWGGRGRRPGLPPALPRRQISVQIVAVRFSCSQRRADQRTRAVNPQADFRYEPVLRWRDLPVRVWPWSRCRRACRGAGRPGVRPGRNAGTGFPGSRSTRRAARSGCG